MDIDRRKFLGMAAGAAAMGGKGWAQAAADVTLKIAPLKLEIAPGKVIHTVAYNGSVPGPLIRWPEGKPITIDVLNQTADPDLVHWHGQWIPSLQDGAMEEGSPMIAPGGQLRYQFTPQPAGFRWYHTHTYAGHDLKKGMYSGQFGCFYVEPKHEAGDYDREVFLTLHDWNASMGGGADASMDAVYEFGTIGYGTIGDRMLGHGEPVRVKQGEHVIFRILNASATLTHWLALAGHEMTVVAMDGNPVPNPGKVAAVRLAPAERIDVMITMTNPGVWVLGETREDYRKAGTGVVVEYAGAAGEAQWADPSETSWDYSVFAQHEAVSNQIDKVVPLIFKSRFRGHWEFDYWTINGKSYPKTDVVPLIAGKRYRLAMRNMSTDDHPIHLHRHTFEVASLDGRAMRGLRKDVLVVKANGTAEVDFVASNPGDTLFHCHQQTHMDFGFMMLFRYVADGGAAAVL